MLESQYSVFCNYFGKFREPPIEGLLLKNSKSGEGANGSLPFFVWRKEKTTRLLPFRMNRLDTERTNELGKIEIIIKRSVKK